MLALAMHSTMAGDRDNEKRRDDHGNRPLSHLQRSRDAYPDGQRKIRLQALFNVWSSRAHSRQVIFLIGPDS